MHFIPQLFMYYMYYLTFVVLLGVADAKKKYGMLKRHHHQNPEKLQQYLDKTFIPPPLHRKRKLQQPPSASPSKQPAFDRLCDDVVGQVSRDLIVELATLRSANQQLKSENVRLRKENDRLRMWNKRPKYYNQMLKRKNQSLDMWKKKYRLLQKKSRHVLVLERKLHAVTRKAQRVSAAKRKHTERSRNKVSKVSCDADKKSQLLTSDLYGKQEELKYMENEMTAAQEAIQELQQEKSFVNTKVDGKTYTPGVREASYCLQSLGVAQHNVGKAIQVVTKAMADKDVCGAVPCRSTQNNLTKEMKALSRQQVKEAVMGAENMTLKSDGTTKPLGHIVEVQVATPSQTLLLGLREQVGGRADEYVETITESMAAVEKTRLPGGTAGDKCDILSNLPILWTTAAQPTRPYIAS